MAQYYTGTLLASPIVRGSSGDTYGTHHSVLGVGGYLEVNTLAERNALPVDNVSNTIGFDGISSGQRRLGMLVYVREEDTIYQLYIDGATWSGYTTNATKVNALSTNSNWRVFVTGEDSEISGERVYKQFTQITHGFSVGDVLGYDGIEFVKVNTTTAATIEPLGIVTKVVDGDTFNLTFSGLIDTVGITDISGNTISGGTVYYLSNTSGKVSPNKPTSFTELSKPMLVGLSGSTGVVLQYRGIYETITSGGTVSYTEFTGYTATTQAFLDTTVTGATNIGFFTGQTGIQTLPIDHLSDNSLDGNYVSQYNYYFRDSDGYIRIGIPDDGQRRRGYVRQTTPKYSWIWNDYTGDTGNKGWIFVRADVSSDDVYGTKITGSSNITISTPPYTGVTWTEGITYNNGSNVTINTVIGNLGSGDTYNVGGPVYSDKQNQELRLRTIVTESPDILSVKYDEYFIKLSGTTGVAQVQNVGTGVGVYSGTSGNTILLKKIVGGGDTTVTDAGDSVVISSTGGGTGGSGENITKVITQIGHGFSPNDVVGFSGGTYNKAIADGSYDGEIIGIVTNIIDTSNFELTQSGYVTGLTTLSASTTYFVSPTVVGDLTPNAPSTYGQLVRPILITKTSTTGWVLPYQGYILTAPTTGGTGNDLYTGATPSVCSVGGLPVGYTLTGKTYTELFEQILVPELCGTITAPSTSISLTESGLLEIGCTLSQEVTGNFNRGCINPQYCSVSPYRSGSANAYCFTGPEDMPSGWQSCTALSASVTDSSYTVVQGTQTWGVCTRYDCGEPALGNEGTEYCAALPSGNTGGASSSVVGAYPLWATCSTISSIDKISPLYNMSTANNIVIELPAESGGNKQKFEVPCAWLSSRSLQGVQQYNTVSAQWEYPGGSAACSLNLWSCSAASETIQGNSVGYCQYTHACGDRGGVCIRLVF